MKTLTDAAILRNTANNLFDELLCEAIENPDIKTFKTLTEMADKLGESNDYSVLLETVSDLEEVEKTLSGVDVENEKEVSVAVKKSKNIIVRYLRWWYKVGPEKRFKAFRHFCIVFGKIMRILNNIGLVVGTPAKVALVSRLGGDVNRVITKALIAALTNNLDPIIKRLANNNETELRSSLEEVTKTLDVLNNKLRNQDFAIGETGDAIAKSIKQYTHLRDEILKYLKKFDK